MSLMDFFTPKPAAPAPAPAPVAAAPAPGANPPAPPSGNPGAPTNLDGSNTPADPTALYAKMWDNDPSQSGEAPPALKYDPQVLDKVSSGMDFLQGIDPALMQKATSGDISALMQVINQSNQRAYRASLEHNGAVVDNFIGRREQHLSKGLPSIVRGELTRGALFDGGEGGTQLPSFAREQLADTARRIQAAHPDASPQQVAAAAKKYFTDMNDAVNQPIGQKKQNAQAPGSFDWDSWADEQS